MPGDSWPGAIKGYRVTSAAELVPILKESLAAECPVVIDCPVDYSENTRLTDRLGALTQAM